MGTCPAALHRETFGDSHWQISAQAHEASGRCSLALGIHRRQPMMSRQRDDTLPIGVQECTGTIKQLSSNNTFHCVGVRRIGNAS